VNALGAIGVKAEPAVPALAAALKEDRSKEVRKASALALGSIQARNPTVMEALQAAARDPDSEVRQAAESALKNLTANK